MASTTDVRADGFRSGVRDVDLDGDLDLFVTSWRAWFTSPSRGNRLFLNRGDGTFEDVTEERVPVPDLTWGCTPIFADMNGDRLPELLLAADFTTSRYFVNAGDGFFVDVTESSGTGFESNGMGAAVADLDGDGRQDWYVTSIWDPDWHGPVPREGNMLYLNRGEHQFSEEGAPRGVARGGWGWGVVAMDADLDGWTDLFDVHGFAHIDSNWGCRAWRNRGHGHFDEASAGSGFELESDPRALVDLDYDRDGDRDLVVACHDGPLLLFRNEAIGSAAARPTVAG